MGDRPVICYVSHREQSCGVYQFGRRIADALQQSLKYDFRYRECSDAGELAQVITDDAPRLVIYNYHPSTLPWVTPNVTRRWPVAQVGTIHEVTQNVADRADSLLFDYHVAPDPTLLLKNPLVFKTGRLVSTYHNRLPIPDIPTIGSFGFGTGGKGLETLVALVQSSFNTARLRLHLPFARWGDHDGSQARAIVARCEALIYKPGVVLEASHDFLDDAQLLDFLAGNTCNVFVYNHLQGRGISSVLDYALAVQRPVAIRRTTMMRHLWNAMPSICIEDRPLCEIIASGTRPIEPYAEQWCEANLLWDYERIVERILQQFRPPQRSSRTFLRQAARLVRRKLPRSEDTAVPSTQWIGDTAATVDTSTWHSPARHDPAEWSADDRFNRILDQGARRLYRQTVAELFQMLPDLMSRKIPEANVQQAFALDAVTRLLGDEGRKARLLCVGSYEDSAAWGLKRLGYGVEEVDPVINYSLDEFVTRPTTRPGSYDAVFSVSVIEHIEADELFVQQIAELLKPGGIAVLTCDFRNDYRPGAPKPQSDCRLYTEPDLRGRLLPRMAGCALVDEPRWQCPTLDFHWENCDYTFATLVVRKVR